MIFLVNFFFHTKCLYLLTEFFFLGDGIDVYKTFNLLIRRRAKENNFKAVLETVRDLMNQEELKVRRRGWQETRRSRETGKRG